MITRYLPRLLAFAAVVFSSSSSLAVPSYTLVCRGGPLFRALYRGETDAIEMTFKRGNRGAKDGVDAGSCAWIDRGISAAEPSQVCHTGVKAKTVSWRNTGSTLVIKAENAGYFDFIYDPSRTFVFQAFNNRTCLMVTRVGS